MNILINLAQLKKGGGQNVALNFIHSLRNININIYEFYFVVVAGSAIDIALKRNNFSNIIYLNANPLLRILQEVIKVQRYVKKKRIDIVYTYFGYTLLPRKIIQVCGVATSNIFYPEIDFWIEFKGLALLRRKIMDKYRIWGIKRASALIFENFDMMIRARKIYKIANVNTTFIKPTNDNVTNLSNIKISYNSQLIKNHKILILCSWQRNKNILKIPEIACELKNRLNTFTFIITAPEDHSKDHEIFLELIKKYNVSNYIKFIGTVEKAELPALYNDISYVLLMSKLESFSNTILESWFYKRPLLITDSAWARAICGNAAIYINRDSAIDICNKIVSLSLHDNIIKEIVANGSLKLAEYPTKEQKSKSELNYLVSVYENKRNN